MSYDGKDMESQIIHTHWDFIEKTPVTVRLILRVFVTNVTKLLKFKLNVDIWRALVV